MITPKITHHKSHLTETAVAVASYNHSEAVQYSTKEPENRIKADIEAAEHLRRHFYGKTEQALDELAMHLHVILPMGTYTVELLGKINAVYKTIGVKR